MSEWPGTGELIRDGAQEQEEDAKLCRQLPVKQP